MLLLQLYGHYYTPNMLDITFLKFSIKKNLNIFDMASLKCFHYWSIINPNLYRVAKTD